MNAAKLVESIDALLNLDAKGAVSHRVPGLARQLLEESLPYLKVAAVDEMSDEEVMALPGAEETAADMRSMIDGEIVRNYLESACRILHNMSLERVGWIGWFRRWYISDEPLRNDAAGFLRGMRDDLPLQVRRLPEGSRRVGDD